MKLVAINAEDLIKLKLERFQRQDPEDIMAIIDSTGFSYNQFKGFVQEMLPTYIGNTNSVILSAREVVERKYSDCFEDFKRFFPFK